MCTPPNRGPEWFATGLCLGLLEALEVLDAGMSLCDVQVAARHAFLLGHNSKHILRIDHQDASTMVRLKLMAIAPPETFGAADRAKLPVGVPVLGPTDALRGIVLVMQRSGQMAVKSMGGRV